MQSEKEPLQIENQAESNELKILKAECLKLQEEQQRLKEFTSSGFLDQILAVTTELDPLKADRSINAIINFFEEKIIEDNQSRIENEKAKQIQEDKKRAREYLSEKYPIYYEKLKSIYDKYKNSY